MCRRTEEEIGPTPQVFCRIRKDARPSVGPPFMATPRAQTPQTTLRRSLDSTSNKGSRAKQIRDRERNFTKYILARVCTLNVCGYYKLLRNVQ